MAGNSNLVDLEMLLEHETAAAILVITEDEAKLWIPKSQCECERSGKFDKRRREKVTVTMEQWKAEELGLV